MWYAMQIITRQEENTIALCRTIIDPSVLSDIFYPQAETMKKRRGNWVKQSLPLFPGYLFVVTDQVEELKARFHQVPKLTKVLGAGSDPIPLTEAEIEWFQKILNSDYVAEFSTGIIEGDKLVIEKGALKGMEGLVKRLDRHKRTAVLEVEMFGRKVEMTLGVEVVKKV